MYELICPAKTNVNELDVEVIFWGFTWSSCIRQGEHSYDSTVHMLQCTLFSLKAEAFEVLNVSLNWPRILNFIQWGSCLFKICSGPFKISLMAGKEVIIDTKTPGSWQYFFSPLRQVLLLTLKGFRNI